MAENPIKIFYDEYVERLAKDAKNNIRHLSVVDKRCKSPGILWLRNISRLLIYV